MSKNKVKNKEIKTQIDKIKEEMKAQPVPVKHEFEENDRLKPKALDYFQKEIDDIKTTELNCFFNNVLVAAPQSYHDDVELLKNVKKAYNIMNHLLEAQEVEGIAKEAILGTILIAKIMKNEFSGEYADLYPLATRIFIEGTGEEKVIARNLYENIIRAVESHLGMKTPSLMLQPKAGTVEAEIANAFSLAEMESFL